MVYEFCFGLEVEGNKGVGTSGRQVSARRQAAWKTPGASLGVRVSEFFLS